MYNAQDFVDSHPSNVDLNVPGASYNLHMLDIIMPGIFSQRFNSDEVNNELGRVWIYELNNDPVAWWDLENLKGYSPNP